MRFRDGYWSGFIFVISRCSRLCRSRGSARRLKDLSSRFVRFVFVTYSFRLFSYFAHVNSSALHVCAVCYYINWMAFLSAVVFLQRRWIFFREGDGWRIVMNCLLIFKDFSLIMIDNRKLAIFDKNIERRAVTQRLYGTGCDRQSARLAKVKKGPGSVRNLKKLQKRSQKWIKISKILIIWWIFYKSIRMFIT